MSDNDNPYLPPREAEVLGKDDDADSSWSDIGGVVIGLNLVYYGIVIMLVSMVSLLLTIALPGTATLAVLGLTIALPATAMLAVLGVIVAYLMMLVGPLFCAVHAQARPVHRPV